MRVMLHHDRDPRCPLVCFGQVVARDPFILVGRQRKPAFAWRDLVGLRVAPAGDVPTPWMTFQDDLQRAGLDPKAIAGNRVRPMARNLAAYRRGTVDVVQVFEPYADQLVSEGLGHVWHRFTERAVEMQRAPENDVFRDLPRRSPTGYGSMPQLLRGERRDCAPECLLTGKPAVVDALLGDCCPDHCT